jgi:hypothetical protein
MIEIKKQNKNTKQKQMKTKKRKKIFKNLLSIHMKLDLNDQLPPSRIHEAQVRPPFE